MVEGKTEETSKNSPEMFGQMELTPDKLTEEAIKALVDSQEVARRLHTAYIGTEHILLGLLGKQNSASGILDSLGVDEKKVINATELISSRGDRPVQTQINPTPRSNQVLFQAFVSARNRNSLVGAEDLLFALASESDGFAGGVLDAMSATPEKIRSAFPEPSSVQTA